jgi:hypothetical protein
VTRLANMQIANDQSILFFPENTALRAKPKMISIDDMW